MYNLFVLCHVCIVYVVKEFCHWEAWPINEVARKRLLNLQEESSLNSLQKQRLIAVIDIAKGMQEPLKSKIKK